MKHLTKLLSLLCALTILVGALGGCDPSGTPADTSSDTPTAAPTDTDNKDTDSTDESESEPPITDKLGVYDLSTNILSEMPRIDIKTKDKKNDFATVPNRENKWDYVDCTVSVSNCDEKFKLSAKNAGVKVRGNYTADYEKKPLRIKFDEKQNMLGLNDGANCKDWVLLADWKDSSMLRNILAFYFGRTILGSDGYYTSDFCNVELYINGQYWGVYLLVEQQEVNPNRVDIYEPEEKYTGTDIGYFVEYDAYYYGEPKLNQFEISRYPVLKSINGNDVICGQQGYSIKNDIYTDKQRSFISHYVSTVFDICYEAIYNRKYYKFNSTYTGMVSSKARSAEEAIAEVIDIDSLVDMYILQEICCDFDLHWSSFFMSVDMSEQGSKKMVFEAPWDFDSAFGLRDACKDGKGYYAANAANPWLLLFVREDWFMDRVSEKWKEARDAGVFDGALDLINAYSTEYSSYYTKNYKKWNNMGVNVGGELVPAAEGFRNQKQAADYLYNWLQTRINYLDGRWGN